MYDRLITNEEKKILFDEIGSRVLGRHNSDYLGNYPVLKKLKNKEFIVDSEVIDVMNSNNQHRIFLAKNYNVIDMLIALLKTNDEDNIQMAYDLIITKLDYIILTLNFGDFGDSVNKYKDEIEKRNKAKEYLKRKFSKQVLGELADAVILLIELH